MQLMDSTADELGVTNVFDPEQNIRGGTEYLSKMIDRYNGNLIHALAAYNAGPTRVDRYKGVPPYRETKRYIKKIKRVLEGYGIAEVKDIPVKKKRKSPTKLTWKRENGKVIITSVR
jgi:soluble lytic murein transglycosylase-like protein